jgi:hypothetical protein
MADLQPVIDAATTYGDTRAAEQKAVDDVRYAALQAEYDAYREANPEPVPTLLYGASEAAFDALNSAVGSKLRVRRSYDGAMPSTLGGSKAQADVNAGRIPWVSFSSVTAANALSFMASCVSADTEVWVTPLHEVNNGPKMAGPAFQGLLATLMGAKNTARATKVKIIPILTAEPFRTNAYLTWLGGDPADFDAIGIDPYRFWRPAGAPPDPKTGGLGQNRSMAWLIGNAPAFAASIGKPIAIGEYGAHPFPEDLQNRPNWLTETDTFLKGIGAIGACYFHSGQGQSGPWWIDQFHFDCGGKHVGDRDVASLTAFKSLLT